MNLLKHYCMNYNNPFIYRGFRKYQISWGWTFCPILPKIRYFGLFLMEDFNLGIGNMSGISESGTSENVCTALSPLFMK